MKEWKEVKLEDVANVIGGGTPSTKNKNYWEGDIPWLTPKDLRGFSGRYISGGERYITKEGYENSSAQMLPKDSVLMSSRAPIGYLAIATIDLCTNQGFKSFVIKDSFVTNLFLFYWLKSKTDYLQQLGTGTTFAEISGKVVQSISILLPPLKEQKAIAEVLSNLDDKIELLQKQNETLEQLAETLFRQWFVEEAEDDWEEKTLGDIALVSSGKPIKRKDFIKNGEYPILGANGEIGRSNNYLCEDKLIYTGRVGTLGNVFIINSHKVWLSDNTLIFRSKSFFYLVYFILKFSSLEIYDVGSTQPLIRQTDIKKIKFKYSTNKRRINNFECFCELFFSKIESNQLQIQTLSKMRDTLLPKLMSGEVRVKLAD